MDTKKQELNAPFSSVLEEISIILKTHENFNLSQYKTSTVSRRIARRMSLSGLDSYTNYLEKLRISKEERQKLVGDILINVTDFFRDHEAFIYLEKRVIPELLDSLKDGEDLRVWVAGCATGEEAYSLAILLTESLQDTHNSTREIKIFATDADEEAIQVARKGVFPASSIEKIPEKYLEKYFLKNEKDDQYRIVSTIRELISFAVHNVVLNPPFSRIHFVSCRNLLIYLQKEMQEKVLSSFYFSLEKGFYLFLGNSESIDNRIRYFTPFSKKWNLYKKSSEFDNLKAMQKNYSNDKPELKLSTTGKLSHFTKTLKGSGSGISDKIRQSILEKVIPAMIVVDSDGKILYYHGKLKPFVIVPSGEPRNDISGNIIPALRTRLRSSLLKVRKTKKELAYSCVISSGDDGDASEIAVKVELIPLKDLEIGGEEAIGIIFHTLDGISEDQKEKLIALDDSHLNQALEQELAETREQLQKMVEELESSAEELKAAHEEALSTNEELQAANEELEATSGELRSLNEELYAVNQQLKNKVQLLQNANNDVQNFFASTNLPTIFLNPELEIQRYTPAAERLLKLVPKYIGRPVFTLDRDLVDRELEYECKEVLQNFQPIRKEKKSYDGRWYIRQISPYKTEDRRIEGVVLTFHHITEMKHLTRRAENREKQHAVVAKLGLMALSGTEPEELMRHAARQIVYVLEADFCKILKYQPEENNFKMVAGIGWREGLVGKVYVPNEQNSQAGYTFMVHEPVIVKDLADEKRFGGPELLLSHRVVSGISCIINHSDPPYGVIGVHTKEYKEFTNDDANFLLSVANMVSTAVRTKEDKLKLFRSEEQFRAISNSIPQLAWMTDNTGYIFWYNQRWYDYTGTKLEEMKGWGWQKVHHEDHIDRVVEKFKHQIEIGESWEDTFPLRGADGKYRWFLSRANPIRNEKGEVIHWFGTNTDITEQREMEASLMEAINKLEKADEKKNEFLAILGHELRNPLAAIKGSTEILELEMRQHQPNKVIDIMQRSISTMAKLLDDLLDFSRISRNVIKLELSNVDISAILKAKLHAYQKQYEDRNQKLHSEIENGLFIKGDPTRLEQIFSNLLNNAGKFTPDGGKIEVKAWKEGNKVVVQISDEGIGINKEEIENIFEAFYQVTPSGKAASGLGIGLSLVKKLTELHKGTIQVSSDGPGKGTSFRITLPSIKVKGNRNQNSKSNKKDFNLALKVVLIDDNEDILLTFSALLAHRLNCEVFTAANASDGLKLIREINPDVAFVDIGLPDMSGHEIARTLRSTGYKNRLIAASGYSHKEARVKSEEAGFDYHLAKPLTFENILHALSLNEKS